MSTSRFERYESIVTIADLVREVSNVRTGGYEVEFEIQPNLPKARVGDGFFLVVSVSSNDPDPIVDGEWWFWDDNTVMQVL